MSYKISCSWGLSVQFGKLDRLEFDTKSIEFCIPYIGGSSYDNSFRERFANLTSNVVIHFSNLFFFLKNLAI